VGSGWGGGDGKRAIERGTALTAHGIKIEIKLRNGDGTRFLSFSLPESWMGGGFVRREGWDGPSTSIYAITPLHTTCLFPLPPSLNYLRIRNSVVLRSCNSKSSTPQPEIFLSLRFHSPTFFSNPYPSSAIIRLLRVPNLAGSRAHLTRSDLTLTNRLAEPHCHRP